MKEKGGGKIINVAAPSALRASYGVSDYAAAKGGIIVGITKELNIPIRYVGVGEGMDDLRPFVAEDFVSALLGTEV